MKSSVPKLTRQEVLLKRIHFQMKRVAEILDERLPKKQDEADLLVDDMLEDLEAER